MSDIVTPPLSEAEIVTLRTLVVDYERSSAIGRLLWKCTLVAGGFLVGLATFLAAMSSFIHSLKGGQ
jgi:hypothetical protein